MSISGKLTKLRETLGPMISNLVKTLALAGLVSAPIASAVAAQTPTEIRKHRNWGAYFYNDTKAGKICYILSVPVEATPKTKENGAVVNHGDVFFMVAQKPNGTKGLEPQVEVGYTLKPQSDVVVDIDGQKFNMFVEGPNAWLKDISSEPKLVAAMKAGKVMKVNGESSRGTKTSYTYSLSGVTAALNEVTGCK